MTTRISSELTPPSPRSSLRNEIHCSISGSPIVDQSILRCQHIFSRSGLIDTCTHQIQTQFMLKSKLVHPTCPICLSPVVPVLGPKDVSAHPLLSKIREYNTRFPADFQKELDADRKEQDNKFIAQDGSAAVDAPFRQVATLICMESLLTFLKKQQSEFFKKSSPLKSYLSIFIQLKLLSVLKNVQISGLLPLHFHGVQFFREKSTRTQKLKIPYLAEFTIQMGDRIFTISLNKDNHLDLISSRPATWKEYFHYLREYGLFCSQLQEKAKPFLKVGAGLAASYYLNLATGLTALVGIGFKESTLKTALKTACVFGLSSLISSVHPFAQAASLLAVHACPLLWDTWWDRVMNAPPMEPEAAALEEEGVVNAAGPEELHED